MVRNGCLGIRQVRRISRGRSTRRELNHLNMFPQGRPTLSSPLHHHRIPLERRTENVDLYWYPVPACAASNRESQNAFPPVGMKVPIPYRPRAKQGMAWQKTKQIRPARLYSLSPPVQPNVPGPAEAKNACIPAIRQTTQHRKAHEEPCYKATASRYAAYVPDPPAQGRRRSGTGQRPPH